MIDLLLTQNKNTQTARQLAELFCLEQNRMIILIYSCFFKY